MKGCLLLMGTLFFKFLASLFLIALFQTDGCKGCLEKERIGLLKIKSFFISISDKEYADDILTSWVDDPMSDCCGWERVQCNATTRQVMELSFDGTMKISIDTLWNGYSSTADFSLFFPFQELQSLDLSSNFFRGWDENKANHDSFGSLKQLKTLNLGSNLFNDSVLPYLSTLISLTTLILSENRIEGLTPNQGLANLTKLKVLHLSDNTIYGSVIKLGLSNLTNLEVLDLSYNDINGSLADIGLVNFTKLKVLDLSVNEINGSATISGSTNLINLKELYLRDNRISGLAGICELTSLVQLHLSGNNFRSHLLQCLDNLTSLKVLDISANQLSENIPSGIANLTSLEYLDFSRNNFEGIFSLSSLANHSNLKVILLSTENNGLQVKTENCHLTFQLKALELRNCNLDGTISSFLLQQHDLKYLDLSYNKLVGDFPIWLIQNNTALEVLRLRSNLFTGILQLPSFRHSLLHLDISINSFIGKLPQNMGIILPKMVYINMSKNSFEGNIPSSIAEMKELWFLDLSTNNFSGELPRPLVTDCFSLKLLDLSNNNFYGQIFPKYMNLTALEFLYLNDNYFSGKIDDGLLTSKGLLSLDISNNKFSGQIPHWIGNFSSSLRILLMSKNLLEGNVPTQLNSLEFLSILDISRNRLSGSISSSLNISSIKHLYLQENALDGPIPNLLFRSSKLMTLDLRDNQLLGTIPHQINEYSDLRVLLMGGNHLQGYIPNQLCQLQNLGILDLSRNRLNGSIPSCFIDMLPWKEGNDGLYRYEVEELLKQGTQFIGTYYNSSLQLSSYREGNLVINERVHVELVIKNRNLFFSSNSLYYVAGLDLSCNELTGEIPSEIGELQDIRGLNLSHNLLSGPIPNSFSNLKMIESLDLSFNKLSGQIPLQLIELTFLSTFNVSYNYLSGPIPDQCQFATFDVNSYRGNSDFCGSIINKSCINPVEEPATTFNGGEEDETAIDVESFKWSFGASYLTFALALFAILWIDSHWRRLWFLFIEARIDWCYYWLLKFVHIVRDHARSQ